MKKILLLNLLLFISSLVFSQKNTKSKAVKTVKSDWVLIKDPYKNTKQIVTTIYKKDTYRTFNLEIKKYDNEYYWAMMDGQYLSREQGESSIITVYVLINGEMKKYLCMNGNPLNITAEIFEALKIGSMGAFQFGRDPNYYEFSLNGFNKALLLLD